MAKTIPLTAFLERQRVLALERFAVVHPVVEKETSQAQVARTHLSLPSSDFRFYPVGYINQVYRTLFSIPPVSASIEKVLTVFAAFSYLVEVANQHHQGREMFLMARRFSHV